MDQETQDRLRLLDEALLKLATSDLRQAQSIERQNQLIEEMHEESKDAIERHVILLDQAIKSQLRLEELSAMMVKLLRSHEDRLSAVEVR